MSVITNSMYPVTLDVSTSTLMLMILSSSFFGSWHCAGMCSPLASIAARQHQLTSYQLGRVISYSLLGAVAGILGNFLLDSSFKWIQMTSIIMFSSLLILTGYFSFKDRDLYAPLKTHRFMKILFHLQKRWKLHSGFSIGLFTGLLPCGWLYTYLLAAATTKNPLTGALVMSLFVLGSMPALSAISFLIQKNLAYQNQSKKRIAGVVLIFAGLYALGSHFLYKIH